MSDTSFGSALNFGGSDEPTAGPVSVGGAPLSGADVTPAVPLNAPVPPQGAVNATSQAQPPAPSPGSSGGMFGSGITFGAQYTPPDPQQSALDQTSDMLQQRVKRANAIASNPIAAFFNPEAVQAARDFVPQATEKLQQIKTQQAQMQANRQQAATLGLSPGEVPDEATQADRVEVAKRHALDGSLPHFQGLQIVSPKDAEIIAPQVMEKVGSHLTNAQLAYDSLSGMQNQGQYAAKLNQLRRDGTLSDLEALGLKVPPSFDQFNASKASEGKALRDARIGLDGVRNSLEARNTAQPMEEKEAKTYENSWKTAYGDTIQVQPARVAATNARGGIIDGYDDPRKLGRGAVLATPDQRKSIKEDAELAVPKDEMEKLRQNNRTYALATTGPDGKPIPSEGVLNKKGERVFINDNPNVQQGIAEGLASALRGGPGGANVGLLKIETSKRGYIQGLLDSIKTNYAGAINTISGEQVKPYLTQLTQKEQRDVLDFLKGYNEGNIPDRLAQTARRAGALGLDASAMGLGKIEATGGIANAVEEGRQAQIALDMQRHQAIGGGRGMLAYGALKPTDQGTPTAVPGGTPTTQLPGPGLQTPVQQATNPQSPAGPAPSPTGGPAVGSGAPPAGPTTPGSGPPAPAGGSPAAPAPMTVAGQQVTAALPPGASPAYLSKVQGIETRNSKDPWTAGNDKSSAGGAFQFINSTWGADKPPGAPDKARDATPQQQAEAAATRATKNAATLTKAGIPVNDTNLYIAHNLGEGAGPKLLQAGADADARTVVGEAAARNNPLFFRGKPTVATVLARYQAEMDKTPDDSGPKPKPGAGGATAEAPGLLTRISRMLSQGVAGTDADKDKAVRDVGDAATEHAPAIASTLGAVGGSLAGPAGTVAGGAAGGSAGQSLKDYLQNRPQNPTEIAKQGLLGGVLGVASEARPILAAAGRVMGSSAVEGGAKAVQGGDTADVIDAATQGATAAAGGELFGRALGMAGHKVFSMFAPDAQTAVRTAAADLHAANETLAKENPTLPGAAGAASTKNPAYEAAQAAKEKAETVLKDAGLKPEEAAYAAKVTSEGVPKQEAEVARPGAVEQANVGKGYDQLRSEVGAAGVGAVKPTPKLPDGPRAAVESGKVVQSKANQELADHVEMAITAPAANWQEKWTQLTEARSQLLQAERDALSSTSAGKSKTAGDMRALADTVRVQQAKAAKYVFGEKDGEAFMSRLKVLDTRYRNLMEATNGGDMAAAARMTGEAGRDIDRKFRAFAHDDPLALSAWTAMRKGGSNVEKDVRTLVGAEKIPYIGKAVSIAKMAGNFNEWLRDRAAGSPVSFADLVRTNAGAAGVGQSLRDLGGTAAQRGAVMQ